MEEKVLANKSKEGLLLYLIVSIISFIIAFSLTFLIISNFDWIMLCIIIYFFLFSIGFLLYSIILIKAPIELLKYNEKYLIVKNEKIKWGEIESFKALHLYRNLFHFKYGGLVIKLKSGRKIKVTRVENIDDTLVKVYKLKDCPYWKR